MAEKKQGNRGALMKMQINRVNAIRLILILFSLFLGGCSKYTYFQRIYYNEETKKYIRDFMIGEREDSKKIIVEVLESHGEDYYIKDGFIYITKELWRDKKRLWIYCEEIKELKREREERENYNYEDLYNELFGE
jgi:hypothetical protein